jgi:hypothetical protein
MENGMDTLQLYRRTQAAASALGSLLEIARLQNYGRVDALTSSQTIDLLVRDAENERILFHDLDFVVAGVADLRAVIAERRAAVTK